MASFHRLLGRPHRAAAASVGALLLSTSTCTPSTCAPPVAWAFSQPAAAVGRPPSVHVMGAPSLLLAHHQSPLWPPSPHLQIGRGTFRSIGQKGWQSTALAAVPLISRRHDVSLAAVPSDAADDEPSSDSSSDKGEKSTLRDDLTNIVTLVGAQALLIPISIVLARSVRLPNNGLGEGFAWTSAAAIQGLEWTVPLFAIAGIMRLIEPYSPALQGVTRATQRSVLAVMGKRRRPIFALLVSLLLGSVAGWGEEWLFRGVFQTILSEKYSANVALGISGVVFGLLHAVTPVYALLAGAASIFFGYLYNLSENLAVPMICHAVYDVGALMWAHWSVTALSNKEQDSISESGPGAPIMDASIAGK